MFVDLFVFYFNHLGTPTGIYPENFVKIGLDLAEIYRILKKCLFVCLYVCLFVELFVFYLNLLRTYTGIYPENFVRIGLDLAEILSIYKNVYLFVCLFVCLLTGLFFILIILEHQQEYTLQISWRSDLIWLRYLGSKMFICLFVCLFVYWFVSFLFLSSWDTHRNIPWKFREDPTWFGWDI